MAWQNLSESEINNLSKAELNKIIRDTRDVMEIIKQQDLRGEDIDVERLSAAVDAHEWATKSLKKKVYG